MSDEQAERRREQIRASKARRRAGEPRLRPERAKCGEPAGAKAHRRRGEEVCDACREAVNRAKRERYQATGRKPGRPPKS